MSSPADADLIDVLRDVLRPAAAAAGLTPERWTTAGADHRDLAVDGFARDSAALHVAIVEAVGDPVLVQVAAPGVVIRCFTHFNTIRGAAPGLFRRIFLPSLLEVNGLRSIDGALARIGRVWTARGDTVGRADLLGSHRLLEGAIRSAWAEDVLGVRDVRATIPDEYDALVYFVVSELETGAAVQTLTAHVHGLLVGRYVGAQTGTATDAALLESARRIVAGCLEEPSEGWYSGCGDYSTDSRRGSRVQPGQVHGG